MISLYNFLVAFINEQKEKYSIDYTESIIYLKDLLKEIEEDYKRANLIK